jgi:hypothetical protein
MEERQEKFIQSELNNQITCKIIDKYTDRIDNISIPTVRNILNTKYINGSDMKAVMCLFETLFISSTKTESVQGLHNLSKNVQKWVIKMKKLNVDSSEGIVYITDILSNDIQVIVKVPQRQSGFEGLIREYYIGVTCINKMRYFLPTMMYTMGSFLCTRPSSGTLCSGTGKKTAFVLYEKINGPDLSTLFEKRKLNFDTWLIIFAQLLLTFETSQRQIRFTHFDLHPGNVMVRYNNEQISYDVPLDNKTYHVKTPPVVPVIIDFGLSCVYNKGKYIGSYDFPEFGMVNFMVPGYDMYKFIIFSAYNAKGKLREKICGVLEFYGDDDSYNIIEREEIGIDEAVDEYAKEGTYGKPSTYTPQQMIDWLLTKKEYKKNLNSFITVSDRKQVIPVQYSSSIQKYNDIFNNYDKEGYEKAIQIAEKCIFVSHSYIMNKYNIKVLEKYNDNLNSSELNSRIKAIKKYMENLPNMIQVDNKMLEKVFDIKHPSVTDLKKVSTSILKTTVRGSLQTKKDVLSTLGIFKYEDELIPYLQFYYTIMELKLEKDFRRWVNDFKTSDIFKFYVDNVKSNQRVIRWGQTLVATITN